MSFPESLKARLLPDIKGFPGGSEVKASACNEGDLGSIPGLRSPGEGNGLPTPVFWPRKFQGQKNLAGYIACGVAIN